MIQNPPYKHRFDPFLVMAYGMGFATWGQLLPTPKKKKPRIPEAANLLLLEPQVVFHTSQWG